MPPIEWRAAARTDLLSILDYISDDNPDAAQALIDEIKSKIANLSERPKLYRTGRVAGTREMTIRSNYIVVYAALADRIEILRILHAAREWPPSGPA